MFVAICLKRTRINTGPPMFELIRNLHTTAWFRHAHVCLSKRSLLFSPFLQRQPQFYITCPMQEYDIFCCLHPYLAYPYLSIIDRKTNGNLLLQGLETGYQAYRDIWQCQTWSKAMIDKLYSQKLVYDRKNFITRIKERSVQEYMLSDSYIREIPTILKVQLPSLNGSRLC
jgi:hypothetical protein